MIYRCLIADDNVIERDLLSMFIKKIPLLNLVAECEDALQAADVLSREQIDIVFCDIDMPDLSGTGLLKSLKNPPVFVFITSYRDYAVESFDLDVVDFVVKPLAFERLLQAVNKAIEQVKFRGLMHIENSKEINKRTSGEANEKEDHFFIKENSGITKIKYADVVYVESMGDFSKIHSLKDQTYVVLSGLKNMEAQLPESIFKRVHKQFIANLNHINAITANEVYFENKQSIPVSNTYRQQLLDIFVNRDVIKRNVS